MFGGRKLLYLSRADVEACELGVDRIVEALDEAFKLKGQGQVELPPKPGIHPRPDSFCHAMPGYIAGQEAAGIKWVGAFPANADKGLPYISGLLILNDAETGLPTAVMDCTWITAWRTAGVSAVSARYLARKGASKLAICGLGVQGRTNLDALALVLPDLAEVRVFDIYEKSRADYLAYNRPRHPGLNFIEAADPEQAVRGADVILTAGPISKNPSPVIQPDWLAPGSLSLPLDFDCYYTPAVFKAADQVFTDDVDQMIYYHEEEGHFPQMPDQMKELGDLAAGKISGRADDGERIMACNLGVAMDDMATAPLLVERAKAKGVGVWLDL